VKVEQLSSDASESNYVAARKLFYDAYLPLLRNPEKKAAIGRDDKWKKITILLSRGTANVLQLEMQQYNLCIVEFNKKYKRSTDCGKTFTEEWVPEKLQTGAGYYNFGLWEDVTNSCSQYMFEPFYEDTQLHLYIPRDFQKDYRIALKDATIVD
jgi:hypothetical protein